MFIERGTGIATLVISSRLDLLLICNKINKYFTSTQLPGDMDRIVQILSQMLRIESEKGGLEPASPLRKELISNLLRVSSFEGLSRAQITQIVKVCKDYLDHALEFRKRLSDDQKSSGTRPTCYTSSKGSKMLRYLNFLLCFSRW